MKKSSVWLCLLTALAAVAVTAISMHSISQQNAGSAVSNKSMSNYSTANASSSQEINSATPAQASGSNVYVVKEYRGHIGVYRNNESAPFREYGTDVLLLPESDRLALEHGRAAYTMAEVEKIVEDYDG